MFFDRFDQSKERTKMAEEENEETDNSFIKIVSRNHPMFKNRSMSFTYVNEEGKTITEALPTIPDSEIVCDGCNSLIKDDTVGLYMTDKDHYWGTQCKKCIEKYFSEVPVVGKTLST